MNTTTDSKGQLRRVAESQRATVVFSLNGAQASALEGDTILTAILCSSHCLRQFEFAEAARAGFCLMGACQDCWVSLADGSQIQACQTFIIPGMDIWTERRREP